MMSTRGPKVGRLNECEHGKGVRKAKTLSYLGQNPEHLADVIHEWPPKPKEEEEKEERKKYWKGEQIDGSGILGTAGTYDARGFPLLTKPANRIAIGEWYTANRSLSNHLKGSNHS